jgi:hypothetical protein
MIARRFTALPGGGEARVYTLTELDESHDDALGCSGCGGVIEPGTPLTYDVGPREGFGFYHPDCALAAASPQ